MTEDQEVTENKGPVGEAAEEGDQQDHQLLPPYKV